MGSVSFKITNLLWIHHYSIAQWTLLSSMLTSSRKNVGGKKKISRNNLILMFSLLLYIIDSSIKTSTAIPVELSSAVL